MIDIRQQIDKETLSKRNVLKNVYRTEEGVFELARTLRECGVFDQIPCEPGAVELRNFAIRKMEDLGMLDEESLISLIEWMLKHDWKEPVD
ncbi:MAG: hypothetical protein WDA09_05290 [Bacteriovoracaceae bacterium]